MYNIFEPILVISRKVNTILYAVGSDKFMYKERLNVLKNCTKPYYITYDDEIWELRSNDFNFFIFV